MRELILGGQKSGKSRAAEARAIRWLATPGHEAVVIATAEADDAEMAARIERHRLDRAARVPTLATVEVSDALADAVTARSTVGRLVIVDCLTLWLTQLILPFGRAPASPESVKSAMDALVAAITDSQGPLVLVSNEIGFGVAPLGSDVRRFVDALGLLHQATAAVCERVTLVVAGCEVSVRGAPA